MEYIPVKGYTGSHNPLGRVVQHLIYALFRLLVKLVMDGLTYIPAVMCAYTALCQCVQCQLDGVAATVHYQHWYSFMYI